MHKKTLSEAKTRKQITRKRINALRKSVIAIISGGNAPHIPTDPAKPKSFDECIKCTTKDLNSIAKKLILEILRPSKAQRPPTTVSQQKQEYIEAVELFLANCSGAFYISQDNNWFSKQHFKQHCDIQKDSVYPELRPLQRRIIKDLIEYLSHEDVGLIRAKKGNADFMRVNDSYKFTGSEITKITPAPELKELVQLCSFENTAPPVLIRKMVNGHKYLISYHSEHFETLTNTTAEFNRLLGMHSRTIQGEELPPPKLQRKFLYYGDKKTVLDDTGLFGGRYWGGIEGMKRIDRACLLHDDEETVEVDLSACHITIAYAELLKMVPIEPYTIYPNQPDYIRDIVKKIVNTALNCTSKEEVTGAIIKIISKGELEIPFQVYDNLTEEGKKRGKFYCSQYAPDPDYMVTECEYKLSAIIKRTLQKHGKLFRLVWSKQNYGSYLQRIESDFLAQMMDVAILEHKTTNRRKTVVHDKENFDIQNFNKSYSHCFMFEPIHDGIRVKKKHAPRAKKLFESICHTLGYDIKAEIKANKKPMD